MQLSKEVKIDPEYVRQQLIEQGYVDSSHGRASRIAETMRQRRIEEVKALLGEDAADLAGVTTILFDTRSGLVFTKQEVPTNSI